MPSYLKANYTLLIINIFTYGNKILKVFVPYFILNFTGNFSTAFNMAFYSEETTILMIH
jgi:hypothetical protein